MSKTDTITLNERELLMLINALSGFAAKAQSRLRCRLEQSLEKIVLGNLRANYSVTAVPVVTADTSGE